MPDTSRIQRLKERKLVQWALAYLAGAFVVFQLLDALEGALGLTPTIQRAVLVIVGIGFSISLVLAWYHGEKGHQRVSGPELLIIALLLVIAGAAVPFFSMDEKFDRGRADPLPTREETGRPLIAVIPLDNNSPDIADAYFADGVHEELVSKLAQISALRVTSRFSMDRYRDGANRPLLSQLAAEIGADYLIEGSARIGGGMVRITIQLIDGETDEHLWSGDFDSPYSPEAYIRTQAEIAQRITTRLRAEMTPEEETRITAVPTSSLEAFDRYTRGNVFYAQRTPEALNRALEQYRLSVQADSLFAASHARIAMCYAQKVAYRWYEEGDSVERVLAEGLEKAEFAIRLSPESGDAWVAKGYLLQLLRPNAVSERLPILQRAVSLDPRSVEAHNRLAVALWESGQDSAAIAEARLSLEIDPRFHLGHFLIGRAAYYNADLERAEAIFDTVIGMAPDYENGYEHRALARAGLGDLSGARADTDALGRLGAPDARAFVALLDALEGREEEARAGFEEDGHPGINWARVLVVMGEGDLALSYLEDREVQVRFLGDPFLDPLRSHPRFQALLERSRDDVEH